MLVVLEQRGSVTCTWPGTHMASDGASSAAASYSRNLKGPDSGFWPSHRPPGWDSAPGSSSGLRSSASRVSGPLEGL